MKAGKTNGTTEIEYYSAVQETAVQWLWYPYIPYGKITLLQGDPGDGKSTFILNIAACVTSGREFPDGTKPIQCQNVIYQCSEDNHADTIKPRLLAAGADCEKVAFIVEDETPLTLDDERVEDALRNTSARLVIFDPIQAYIPQDGDMINAVKMRTLMKRLAFLAEEYQCAIVLIGHMNKSNSGKHLYRSLGSIDIAAAARSVLMITRDEYNPAIRYMFPVKTNLSHEGKAIRFLFDKDLGFQFLGSCEYNSKTEVIKDESKSQKTERLLKTMLSGGIMPSVKIMEQLEKQSISERTIRTVAKNIGVKAFRKDGKWYWRLDEKSGE